MYTSTLKLFSVALGTDQNKVLYIHKMEYHEPKSGSEYTNKEGYPE